MAGFDAAESGAPSNADKATTKLGGDSEVWTEYFETPPLEHTAKHGGEIDVHYGDTRSEDGLARGLTAAAESLQVSDIQERLNPMSADERKEMLDAMRTINQDNHAVDEHIPVLTLTETEDGLDVTATFKHEDVFGNPLPSTEYSDSIELWDKGEAAAGDDAERRYRGFRPADYARAAQSGQTIELAKALDELSPADKVRFLSEIEAANRAHHAEDPRTPIVDFKVSEGVQDVTLTVDFDGSDDPYVAKVGN